MNLCISLIPILLSVGICALVPAAAAITLPASGGTLAATAKTVNDPLAEGGKCVVFKQPDNRRVDNPADLKEPSAVYRFE